MKPPSQAQRLAMQTLEIHAKTISEKLADFEKWLVAGYAAVLTFSVPHLQSLAGQIGVWRVQVGLGLLAVAILFSVVVLFLSTMIAGSAAVSAEMRKTVPELLKTGEPLDFGDWVAEQGRGLLWPGSAGFRWGMKMVAQGDFVAGSRLLAYLAQAQAYVVIGQVFLAFTAAGVMVSGIKL